MILKLIIETHLKTFHDVCYKLSIEFIVKPIHSWRSWLRHCATNRNVAGSIPDGVTGIFH
jgi:hypothetical protein